MTQPSAFSRDPRQVPRDPDGWNAGPPPAVLGEKFVTPAPLFFTRSHAPVPAAAASSWRVRIQGMVRRPMDFTLEQLQREFPRREVMATLACAGLRRTELLSVRPIPGELPWGAEAMSTGLWAGVSLADVLAAAQPEAGGSHVEFIGRDDVVRHEHTFGFGGSIPLTKAMNPEVLLAWELNGSPLPPEHGYPLRGVVPGYYGARSVKWLGEVRVGSEPSNNYFQAKAYRVLAEPNPADPKDVSTGTPLGELVLNSAILTPAADATVKAGEVTLSGWAIGRGGRPVGRVELSPDNGVTWVNAELAGDQVPWCWRLWQATVRLTPGRRTLIVRGFDTDGAAQPEHLDQVWNVKGYANNAWHRISVDVAAE